MENKIEHEMAIECLEWFIGIKDFGKFGIPFLVPTIRTMSYIGGLPDLWKLPEAGRRYHLLSPKRFEGSGSGSPGVLCSGIGANSHDAALISLV